jgi:hypothetical protein
MLGGDFEEESKRGEKEKGLKYMLKMEQKVLSEFSLKIFYATIKNIFS